MKRSEHRNSNASDLSSISPPNVQFAIGTPPSIGGGGGRHRSASGTSLSETPPPPSSCWNFSPGGGGGTTNASPLRRSGASSPLLSSAIMKLPALGSPTPTLVIENNNHHHMLGQRAITLPELGASGGLRNFYKNVTTNSEDESVLFHAPELHAETLLDREHNETLAKLNFVVALTDCILEVADSRCAPLSALMSADAALTPPHLPENCKRTERLVLLVR